MDIIDSAKNLLGEHGDQVDGAIDAAAEKIKEQTPDEIDGAVDQGAQMAKDAIDNLG